MRYTVIAPGLFVSTLMMASTLLAEGTIQIVSPVDEAVVATQRGTTEEEGTHKWFFAKTDEERRELCNKHYNIEITREPERNRYRWLMATECTDKPRLQTFAWEGGQAPYTLTITREDGSLFLSRTGLAATSTEVDNFEVAAGYTWQVTDATGATSEPASFTTEENVPRLLNGAGKTVLEKVFGKGEDYEYKWYVATPHGVRDLGGYVGLDGKRSRQNRVIRSSEFIIDETNRDFWRNRLAIKTDIDLRNNTDSADTASQLGADIAYRRFNHFAADVAVTLTDATAKTQLRDAVKLFANEANYPIAFHCVHGKDRTGLLALVLGGILGYADSDLRRDYEATMFWHTYQPDTRLDDNCDWLTTNRVCRTANAASLSEGIVSYAKWIGVTDSEINAIRAAMYVADPEPEPITINVTIEDGQAKLTFSDFDKPLVLSRVYGSVDRGEKYYSDPDEKEDTDRGWEHFEVLANLPAGTSSYTVQLPEGWGTTAKYMRFLLTPTDRTPMKSLNYVSGTDATTQWADTLVVPDTQVNTQINFMPTEATVNQPLFAAPTDGENNPYLSYGLAVDANRKLTFNYSNSTATSGSGRGETFGSALPSSDTTGYNALLQASSSRARVRQIGGSWTNSGTATVPTASANGSIRVYGTSKILSVNVYRQVGGATTGLAYLMPSLGYNAKGELEPCLYDSIACEFRFSEGGTPFVAGEDEPYHYDLLKGVPRAGDTETIEYTPPQPLPDMDPTLPDPKNVAIDVKIAEGQAQLTFGAFEKALVLSMVYGADDKADDYYGDDGWKNFKVVSLLRAGTTSATVDLPEGWGETVKCLRFLLTPADKTPMKSLSYVSGTDATQQWIETDIIPTTDQSTQVDFTLTDATAGQPFFSAGGDYKMTLNANRHVVFRGEEIKIRNSSTVYTLELNKNYNVVLQGSGKRGRVKLDTDGSFNNSDSAPNPVEASEKLKIYVTSKISKASVTYGKESNQVYLLPALGYNVMGELEAGLYDTIRCKMYFSAGTASFVAGPEIADYQKDPIKRLARSGETATIVWTAVPSWINESDDEAVEKYTEWAKAKGVTDPAAAKVAAYAFNCENTDAAIADEAKAFKVTIEIQADGKVKVSWPEGKSYNIDPVIQSRDSLNTGDWHEEQEGDRFFRAILPL